MLHVADLQIDKEIIPLFDYTQNDFAREALEGLFYERPASIEAIRLRQQIIKGAMANGQVLQSFAYHRTELHQVYQFIKAFRGDTLPFNKSTLTLRMELTLFDNRRQVLRSELSQLILLFNRLHKSCFLLIRKELFPPEFIARINLIVSFLSHFRLTHYEALVRSGQFRTGQTVELIQLLLERVQAGDIDAFWENLFLFEAYASIAKGMMKHAFRFPELTSHRFSITGFYHPLLKQPVKNSLAPAGNVLLVTGPNMSGKSTLLKSIGLCVYLGHLGLGVPAAECHLPFFDTISVVINSRDDIKQGYSHFMTEIQTLKKVVLEAASEKKCFAIFDELFRGTNMEDALAISHKTISGLAKFTDSCFLISTHLHQLKETIDLHSGPIAGYYIECNLEGDKPAFTYKLLPGWSDLKIGQIIFNQEGLNELL